MNTSKLGHFVMEILVSTHPGISDDCIVQASGVTASPSLTDQDADMLTCACLR